MKRLEGRVAMLKYISRNERFVKRAAEAFQEELRSEEDIKQ